MLADDRTLILTDLVLVENAIKLLNKYTLCSRLKINIDKTKQNIMAALIHQTTTLMGYHG